MTITPEQVADLQPGDVVRVSIEGPLISVGDELRLPTGQTFVWPAGGVAGWAAEHTLTVVSRAPRPLYVNHPRTSPVPGDVVRAEDSDDPMRVWLTSSNEDGDIWWVDYSAEWVDRGDLPDRLRLLVDGETGQVVP